MPESLLEEFPAVGLETDLRLDGEVMIVTMR